MDTSGIADEDGLENATFSYHWLADGTVISGAAANAYTPVEADEGKAITVQVNFTDDAGNDETLTSAATEAVEASTNNPATGPPEAPRNLTATPGNREVSLSWDPPDDNGNAPATRYRIEWRVDGKDYGTSQWGTSRETTYTTNDQANLANGVKYFFRVKAENGGGNSYGPYGPASEEVSATPTSGSAVDLGTPVLSDTETLHHGMVRLDWQDIEDAGWYVVQYYHVEDGEWLDLPAEGVDIAFHGSSAVVSNLHGLSWLRVRAMSCAGASEWSQIEQLFGTNASDWEGVPVPEVEEGDETEPCPVVLGTPVLSDTEYLHHGMVQLDWQDIEDAGWYVVQYYHIEGEEWLDLPAEGVDVAFHGSSAVVSNLHGLSWLRVGAASCDGASEWSQIEQLFGTNASDWEGVPVPEVEEGDKTEPCSEDSDTPDNNLATGAPTISGTAQVGEALTANTSGVTDADGLSNVQYEYQWLADDSDISGATNATYTPVEADEGKAITVQVNFTDDADNDETLTSAPTDSVAAADGATPSQRRWEYVDVHNAGVDDLEELLPRSGSADPDGEADEEEEDKRKQGKSVGTQQGRSNHDRVNICNRTPEVQDALLKEIRDDVICSTVTAAQLASVDYLYIEDGYSSEEIVPSDFGGLTSLKELTIKNSEQLIRVPANAFDGLDSLTRLYLDNNELRVLDSNAFNGLPALERLGLSENRITAVDPNTYNGLDSLTRLFLNNNELRVLDPDAFNRLPALEALYLYHNALTWLPTDVFHGLSNLKDLRLAHNDLTTLQKGTFEGLTNLTGLDLYENSLASLEPGTFAGLPKLRTLSLMYNELSSLDEDIFEDNSELYWLHLHNNQLDDLPSDVFDNLPILSVLLLNDNQLTSLDEELFDGLSSLRTLHLDNNDLRSLDEDIFEDLTELSTLALVNIGLSTLPEDIFENNTNLSRLYLFDNQINSLPEDVFNGLSALSWLRLDNNQLSTLHEEVFDDLTELERLYLEKNQLTALPEDIFEDLDALERLWLDTNRLTTLPADIFDGLGDTLIELTLSDNEFDSLPDDVFDGLSNLLYLLLHRSELSDLDSGLFDPLTSLWLLYLHGNDLTALPEDIFDELGGLARLYLHDNKLTTLPADVFDGVNRLQRLYLDGNELTTLNADVFDGLGSLQRLDLYSNMLSALPADVFEGLGSSLGELYLQNNGIGQLPDEVFEGLTGLRGLDLSCNELSALNLDVFDPFAGTLTYLDLDANPFSTLPNEAAVHAELTALDALYLGGVRPCLPAFNTDLSALSLSTGTTLSPEFEPPGISTTRSYPAYRADVGYEDTLTVTTATESPNAMIGPSSDRDAEGHQFDNDLSTPGLQVDLSKTSKLTEVWWRVTAENPAYTADYAIEVFRQHRGQTDPRLGSLKLSNYGLTQSFRPDTYEYSAGQQSLSRTMVTAVALDLEAAVEIKLDGQTIAQGVGTAETRIKAAIGDVVTVNVTSEDRTATRTYTVTLTSLPTPTRFRASIQADGVENVDLEWDEVSKADGYRVYVLATRTVGGEERDWWVDLQDKVYDDEVRLGSSGIQCSNGRCTATILHMSNNDTPLNVSDSYVFAVQAYRGDSDNWLVWSHWRGAVIERGCVKVSNNAYDEDFSDLSDPLASVYNDTPSETCPNYDELTNNE